MSHASMRLVCTLRIVSMDFCMLAFCFQQEGCQSKRWQSVTWRMRAGKSCSA